MGPKFRDRVLWVEAGPEEDVLGNGVSQAREDLVLGEQALRTSFLSLRELVDEGGKTLEREPGVRRRGSHVPDILPTFLVTPLSELHRSPHLGGGREKGIILEP